MKVHLEPYSYIVRIYDEGKSYKNKDPYLASLTVTRMENLAFASGLSGTIHRKHYYLFFKELNKIGVKYLLLERRGKNKVINVNDYLQKREANVQIRNKR